MKPRRPPKEDDGVKASKGQRDRSPKLPRVLGVPREDANALGPSLAERVGVHEPATVVPGDTDGTQHPFDVVAVEDVGVLIGEQHARFSATLALQEPPDLRQRDRRARLAAQVLDDRVVAGGLNEIVRLESRLDRSLLHDATKGRLEVVDDDIELHRRLLGEEGLGDAERLGGRQSCRTQDLHDPRLGGDWTRPLDHDRLVGEEPFDAGHTAQLIADRLDLPEVQLRILHRSILSRLKVGKLLAARQLRVWGDSPQKTTKTA